jgi:hypothetical protein
MFKLLITTIFLPPKGSGSKPRKKTAKHAPLSSKKNAPAASLSSSASTQLTQQATTSTKCRVTIQHIAENPL